MSDAHIAYCNAQAEFPHIPKDKTANIPTKAGGKFSYSYADLSTILDKVLPVLNKHKLYLAQPLGWTVESEFFLSTQVIHSPTGQVVIDSKMPVPKTGDPQALGSLITYYRRYAACTALGVCADEDDDGRLAKPEPKSPEPQRRDPEPRPGPSNTGPQPPEFQVPVGKNKGKRLNELPRADIVNYVTWAKTKPDLQGPAKQTMVEMEKYLSRQVSQ